MKKRKAELARIKTLIEADRRNTGDSFTELIVSDLEKLLKDYFDFRSGPALVITKEGGGYRVNASLYASGIRNFGTIPK